MNKPLLSFLHRIPLAAIGGVPPETIMTMQSGEIDLLFRKEEERHLDSRGWMPNPPPQAVKDMQAYGMSTHYFPVPADKAGTLALATLRHDRYSFAGLHKGMKCRVLRIDSTCTAPVGDFKVVVAFEDGTVYNPFTDELEFDLSLAPPTHSHREATANAWIVCTLRDIAMAPVRAAEEARREQWAREAAELELQREARGT